MGFVYFIQADELDRIKIGWAVDPLRRLRLLQTAAPVRLEMLGVIRGSCELERALHRRFRRLLVHGEWFRADAVLARYIRRETFKPTRQLIGDPRRAIRERAESKAWRETDEGRTELEQARRVHRRVNLRRASCRLAAALRGEGEGAAPDVAAIDGETA